MLNKKLLLAIPFTTILSAGVWALDQRYITNEDFKLYDKNQYIRQLDDRIQELVLKKELKLASEYDNAVLEQLKSKSNALKN